MHNGIINGKPTTAYQLWNNQYRASIPNAFLHSPKERMFRGAYTGNEERDAITRSDRTEVYRTPVGLTLLYDAGKSPQIILKKDVYTIYNLITTHLNNVARAMQDPTSGFVPPPPRDLLIFENYSQHLYDIAMLEQAKLSASERLANHDSSLENFLSIFGGRGAVNEMRQANNVRRTPEQIASIGRAWDAIDWK